MTLLIIFRGIFRGREYLTLLESYIEIVSSIYLLIFFDGKTLKIPSKCLKLYPLFAEWTPEPAAAFCQIT